MTPQRKTARKRGTGMLKVPVAVRALEQRIDRALKKDGHELQKLRGQRAKRLFGEYVVVDLSSNEVVQSHIHIERLAKTLKVLEPYETVYTDEEQT